MVPATSPPPSKPLLAKVSSTTNGVGPDGAARSSDAALMSAALIIDQIRGRRHEQIGGGIGDAEWPAPSA